MLHRLKQRGFTLIELMIVVAIIGILAAVAIPAFMNYLAKSKGSEATLNLNKIAKAAKVYWGEHSSFPTAGAKLPAAKACGNTATFNGKSVKDKTFADATTWAGDTGWAALDFQVDEPGLFQYTFTPSGTTSATALAEGDMDCDNTPGIWTLEILNQSGNIQTNVTKPASGVK